MKFLPVEPGNLLVGSNPKSTLLTQPLGSSIAVVAFDPKKKIGGIALPLFLISKEFEAASAKKPTCFIETSIPFFIQRFLALECQKKDLKAWLVGGATLLSPEFRLEDSQKLQDKIAEILAQNGVAVVGSDLGGQHSRTVSLEIGTGRIKVTLNGDAEKVLAE